MPPPGRASVGACGGLKSRVQERRRPGPSRHGRCPAGERDQLPIRTARERVAGAVSGLRLSL